MIVIEGAPTPAERAALLAVCQPGASYDSAAATLGISRTALSRRLQRLYRRLGVNSDAQAAMVLYGRRRPPKS